MKTAIVVVTSPRQGVSYLAPTLEDLGELPDGVEGIVLSDGPFPSGLDRSSRWVFVEAEGPSGSRRAFWRAFEVARELGADRTLFLEDDVTCARGALGVMAATEVPDDLAFVSFFNGRAEEKAETPRPYLHRVPLLGRDGRGFWGSCAILVPRETLDFLVGFDPMLVETPFPLEPDGCADMVIAWLLCRSRWHFYGLRIPCLVAHVGDVSTPSEGRNPRGRRRGSNFM